MKKIKIKAGDIVTVDRAGNFQPMTIGESPIGLWTDLGLVFTGHIKLDEWSRQGIELRDLIKRLEKHLSYYEAWK